MIGERLGPWRIESELGSGGMGTVYLARAEEPGPGVPVGAHVALKVLHSHLLGSPGTFRRFLREAEIGLKLRHPNVVRTLGADAISADDRHHHVLVMEYVEGQTLRQLLEEVERVPEELCLHIGREVAEGLSAIHAAGAIHRDLKPENVLLTKAHDVKIMDLGVALLNEEAIRLSQTGMFVGSLYYSSPEQFRDGGKHVDARADLHALGLLLYELAGGDRPYAGDEIPQVVRNVLEAVPRRLGELNPQVSPFFEEVVHWLLEKEPERRPGSATTLAEILREGERSSWWGERSKALRAGGRRPMRQISLTRETEVYGREEEIGILRGLYREAKEGRGRIVLVTGEAGIGKSRLVDELVVRLAREGEDLDFLFGSFPPGGAATAAGAYVEAWREHLGSENLAPAVRRHLARSPGLAAGFAALLAGDSPPPDAPPLTRETLQTAFVHTIRSFARRRPTILCIEDLHYTTEEGRALFAALAQAARDHRLLLVGTTRQGLPKDWLSDLDGLPEFRRLVLGRLGPRDLSDLLVEAFASKRLAGKLSFPISQKSDGNPFFAFEIVREMKEHGVLSREEDGTWVSTGEIGAIEIPSTVRELIRTRITALEDDERELLDVAACSGFEFDGSLVADAMGISRVPALRLLAHIESKHRLVRAKGRRFVFDHHQVRDSLYEAMPPMLREEYHDVLAATLVARAGDAAIEGDRAVRVCDHGLRGTSPRAAVEHLGPAMDHLEREYRLDEAADLGLRVLGTAGAVAGADRLRLLLRTIPHLNTTGRRNAEARLLEEAEALAEEEDADGALVARVLAARGWRLVGTGRYEEARELLEQAVARARAAEDRGMEARASGDLGIALFLLGRYEEARACHETHLRIAEETEDARGVCNATGNLGNVLFALGRYASAEESYERWLGLSRDIGSRRGEAAATGNLGAIRSLQGRHEEAMELHERNRSLCRDIGYRMGEARATGATASALLALGRYREARTELESYLERSRDAGHVAGEVLARVGLGELLWTLGNEEAGAEHVDAAAALAEGMDSPSILAETRSARARLAEARGRTDEAESGFREAIRLRREIGDPAPLASLLASLGGLLLGTGREGEAEPVLAEAESLVRDRDLPGPLARIAALRLRSSGEEPGAVLGRIEALEPRLTHAERLEVRYHLYRATGDDEHLREARRLLEERLDQVPEKSRAAALSLALHRAIHGEG